MIHSSVVIHRTALVDEILTLEQLLEFGTGCIFALELGVVVMLFWPKCICWK